MTKKMRLAAAVALVSFVLGASACADITGPGGGPEPAANTAGSDT